jgi:DNA polymerase III epsilon subunit-like protein
LKYISIDLEMTGLNEDTCDILEFGAVADDLREMVPLKNLPVFHCYFVKDNYVGEATALSMHPTIFERIGLRSEGFTYVNAMKFGHMFKQFLSDCGYDTKRDKITITVAGENFGACDLQFLKRKTDLGKHVKIRHRIIDPAVLYLEPEDDRLPSLDDCLERAGIFDGVNHDAVSDAMDVVKVVRDKLGDMFSV